jgi:hypothetical protein
VSGSRTLERVTGIEPVWSVWKVGWRNKIVKATTLIKLHLRGILVRVKLVWALHAHVVEAVIPKCAAWVLVRGPTSKFTIWTNRT